MRRATSSIAGHLNSVQHEPIFGIDTIKVGFHVEPEGIDLDGWKKIELTKVKEDDEHLLSLHYQQNIRMSNGAALVLKYAPYDYKKRILNLLLIEFSFPKLLYGDNCQNILDWAAAIEYANTVIGGITCLPCLPNIQNAVLYRLDICANFQVGNLDLADYLQVLSNCKHPHREKTVYRGQSAVFPAREIRTTFYDKFKQSKKNSTCGTLRLEIQFLNKRIIGKMASKKSLTLGDLTLKMIAKRLLKELKILHLDSPIVCGESELSNILSKYYSVRRVQSMLGYFHMKRILTSEQLLARGYSRRNISYYEKLFQDAGVSSNSIESKKTLRALSLFIPEVDEICNKPLSVTRVSDVI